MTTCMYSNWNSEGYTFGTKAAALPFTLGLYAVLLIQDPVPVPQF